MGTSFVFWNRWRKVELDLSPLSRLDRTALAALQMRQSMLHRYEHLGFDDDRLAVAIAMTLGDKSRLTNDLREVYSISGASHVLALSGLHIGIIYALMVLVVGYRRLGWLREVVVILGIWAYAFFTGLSPSVVRAAVMITVYSIVSLANRDRMSLNTLALTAIIMLVWNPLYLYDVGFQMSFMAVLFILLFYPTLFALLPERWIDKLSFSLTTRFPFVGHDTEADFLKWKAWSDEDYHDEEKQDHVQANHTIPLSELSEEVGAADGPEVIIDQRFERLTRERYTAETVIRVKGQLTEKQFRRLWMYYVVGLTQQQIADAEEVGQRRISTSITSAVKRIKKFFSADDQG